MRRSALNILLNEAMAAVQRDISARASEGRIAASAAPEPRDLSELADECGTLVTGLRCAADHLALDADWEIAEPRAATDALVRLEPLAERLASVIADLRRHRGGEE